MVAVLLVRSMPDGARRIVVDNAANGACCLLHFDAFSTISNGAAGQNDNLALYVHRPRAAKSSGSAEAVYDRRIRVHQQLW